MKIKFLVFILSIFFSNTAQCDIIFEYTHNVDFCAKIVNIEDFPNLSLIAKVSGPVSPSTYVIKQTDCLSIGYKMNSIKVYACESWFVKYYDLNKVNFANNPNVLESSIPIKAYYGDVNNSNPINRIQYFYKIAGFTETTVEIYLWKEIISYNNGADDKINYYEYEGNTTLLKQNISTGLPTKQIYSNIQITPNPAKSFCDVSINTLYQGEVLIAVSNISGNQIAAYSFQKSNYCFRERLYLGTLSKGTYFITIQQGNAVKTEKLIIQ
ncbi:MAG TPA: T9SS type A sorting domain-containing protein [Bacteroidales bacterium]|nr:T9SS type A sorting domain-containing protein [Bacteroidales bacterium]